MCVFLRKDVSDTNLKKLGEKKAHLSALLKLCESILLWPSIAFNHVQDGLLKPYICTHLNVGVPPLSCSLSLPLLCVTPISSNLNVLQHNEEHYNFETILSFPLTPMSRLSKSIGLKIALTTRDMFCTC